MTNGSLSSRLNSGAPLHLGQDDVFVGSGAPIAKTPARIPSTASLGKIDSENSEFSGPTSDVKTHPAPESGALVPAPEAGALVATTGDENNTTTNGAEIANTGSRAPASGLSFRERAAAAGGVGALTLHQPENIAYRADIRGFDAQDLYPPTACVFVAK